MFDLSFLKLVVIGLSLVILVDAAPLYLETNSRVLLGRDFRTQVPFTRQEWFQLVHYTETYGIYNVPLTVKLKLNAEGRPSAFPVGYWGIGIGNNMRPFARLKLLCYDYVPAAELGECNKSDTASYVVHPGDYLGTRTVYLWAVVSKFRHEDNSRSDLPTSVLYKNHFPIAGFYHSIEGRLGFTVDFSEESRVLNVICNQIVRGSVPLNTKYRMEYSDGTFVQPKRSKTGRWFQVKYYDPPLQWLNFTLRVYDRFYDSSVEFKNLKNLYKQEMSCHSVYLLGGSMDCSTAVVNPRYRDFTITSDIMYECPGTMSVVVQWSVYKVTEESSLSAEDTEYAFLSTVETTDITVPKYSFEYGCYIFNLTVGIGDVRYQDFHYQSNVTWIRIVESPMVAHIAGGSARATGWNDTLTLDANKSRDPDSVDPHDGVIFDWFCRKNSESFPEDLEPVAPTDSFLGGNVTKETIGCFDDIDGFYLADRNGSKTVHLARASLHGNMTYVFRVLLSKNNKSSVYAEQSIEILPGNPPVVLIRCYWNCNSVINLSQRITLAAVCVDCLRGTTQQFYWSETTGNKKINWKTETSGRAHSSLRIKRNTFLGFVDETYKFRVQVTSWTGSSSFAEYTFKTNSPPSNGICEISPLTGIVLDTKFSIACNGFTDSDQPLTYTFSSFSGLEYVSGVKSSDTDAGSLLYYGLDSMVSGILLPLGSQERNYQVLINIKISDSLGVSMHTFLNVTVKEPEIDSSIKESSVEDTALSLTSGKDSKLEQLVELGDLQRASQLITSISSLLNTKSHANDKLEYEEHLNVDHHSSDDGAGHQVDTGMTEEQKRTKVRETMVESLAKIEVTNLESVQQKTAALAHIIQVESEVSLKAQDSATRSLKEMSRLLKEKSIEGAGEIIEQTASLLILGLNHVTDAASIASKKHNTTTTRSDVDNMVNGTNRNISLTVMQAVDDITDAMLVNTVPGEEPTVLESHSMSIVLSKQELWSIGDSEMKDNTGANFLLPSSDVLFQDVDRDAQYTSVIMQHFHENPFSWGNGDSITSTVSNLQIKKEDHTEVEMENLSQPIQMSIPHHGGGSFQPLTMSDTVSVYGNLTLFNINLHQSDPTAMIEVHSLDPLSVKFGAYLLYNGTADALNYDLYFEFSTNVTANNTWLLRWHEKGTYSMAVDVLSIDREDVEEVNVTVAVYLAECRYWNTKMEKWTTDGCQVSSSSTIADLHCECNHLSFFSGSVIVVPYMLDLTDIVLFATFMDNPIMVSTVMAIFVFYLLCAVLARRWDRRDLLKTEVIPLEDNNPLAEYSYRVTVFTGVRQGAGTTAIVTLTLNGSWQSSQPHVLNPSTSKRRLLQRAGTDIFLLTTPEYLGELKSVRLWHNNSGNSPSWYASRVLVHDLQSGDDWHFLCNSWLSVESGLIDEIFTLASDEDLAQFQHIFVTKTIKDLSDGHLWLSIISRPPHSSFTRLQRISCCLSLLLCTMLTGLMFYGIPKNPAEQSMDFGHFKMTMTEVMIGIESGLVVFPINLIIVAIFRNIKVRKVKYENKPKLKTPDSSSLKTLLSSDKTDCNNDLKKVVVEFNNSSSVSMIRKSLLDIREDLEKISSGTDTQSSLMSSNYDEDEETISGSDDETLESLSIQTSLETNSSVTASANSGDVDEELTVKASTYVQHIIEEAMNELLEIPHDIFENDTDFEKAKKRLQKMHSLQEIYMQSPDVFYEEMHTMMQQHIKESEQGLLPWWFVYVGWFTVISTCLTSAFFVMLYGLKYGRQRSIEWLLSMAVSLGQSIFVIQPFKVVLLALFVSLFLTKPEGDDVGNEKAHVLRFDSSDQSKHNLDSWMETVRRLRQASHYKPPSKKRLEAAQKKKEMQHKVSTMMKEFIAYGLFLWLILTIAFSHRDKRSIYLNEVLEETFGDGFDEIASFGDMHEWMNGVLLDGLYGEGDGYIGSDCNCIKLLGSARLRQLRVKLDECHVSEPMTAVIMSCESEYSLFTEDTHPYTSIFDRDMPAKLKDMWTYQPASIAKGSLLWGSHAAYSSGGYIAELGTSSAEAAVIVDEIFESYWLDSRTRALFIEFTVYSPSTNIISAAAFLLEMPSMGSISTSFELLTSPYYQYTIGIHLFIIVCEIAYVFILIYLIYSEMVEFKRYGVQYFHSFWNVLDTVLILLSLFTVGVFISRVVVAYITIDKYQSDTAGFTSFFPVAFLDQIFGYLMCCLVLLSMIRLLKIMRSNSSMYLIQRTFSYAAAEIISFSVILFILLAAYGQFCSVAFSRTVADLNGLGNIMGSLLSLILGEYDLEQLFTENRFLGRVFFLVFICSLPLTLMSVYTTMMIRTFLHASHHRTHSEDSDVFLLMMSQITCGQLFKPAISYDDDDLDDDDDDSDIYESKLY